MKRTLPLLTLIFFVACRQVSTTTQQNDENIPVDSLSDIIIKYDSADLSLPFENVNQAKLSSQEVIETEELLKRAIDDLNEEMRDPKNRIQDQPYIDLTKYSRQLVPVLNSKNEKEVWINCYCGHRIKKTIVSVEDGGKCYFNLKVNLTRKTYYDLMINSKG